MIIPDLHLLLHYPFKVTLRGILCIYFIFYLIKFSCVNSTFSFPFEDKAFFSSFLFILKDLLASFEVVALSDTALPEEVEQLYFPTASFSSLLFRGLDSSSSALLLFEIVSITRNNEEFFKYFYRYKIWHRIYGFIKYSKQFILYL